MENNFNLQTEHVIMLDEACPPREETFPPVFHQGDWIISDSGRIGRIIGVDQEVNGYYLDTEE